MEIDEDLPPKELPEVLVIKPPPPMIVFGDEFISKKFKILKAWESPLPLEQFLTNQAHSVQAVLCSGASPITPQVLELLPSLRLVVTASAGINHIDLPECRRRGIAVANSGHVFNADGADAAVGLLIDVFRRISASNHYVRRGLWASRGDCPLASKVTSLSLSLYIIFSCSFNYLCLLFFLF